MPDAAINCMVTRAAYGICVNGDNGTPCILLQVGWRVSSFRRKYSTTQGQTLRLRLRLDHPVALVTPSIVSSDWVRIQDLGSEHRRLLLL